MFSPKNTPDARNLQWSFCLRRCCLCFWCCSFWWRCSKVEICEGIILLRISTRWGWCSLGALLEAMVMKKVGGGFKMFPPRKNISSQLVGGVWIFLLKPPPIIWKYYVRSWEVIDFQKLLAIAPSLRPWVQLVVWLSVLLQHRHWNLPWLRALFVPGPAAPCAFCRAPDGMVEDHLACGMFYKVKIGLHWISKGATNLKGQIELYFFLVMLPQISKK